MKPTLAATTYLTSKWLVLIRPLLAGFHRPLTAFALADEGAEHDQPAAEENDPRSLHRVKSTDQHGDTTDNDQNA
jgi:hypothetical protein